jgi:hypothetical protein
MRESVIMRLGRRVKMSGQGLTIPIITGDPEVSGSTEPR